MSDAGASRPARRAAVAVGTVAAVAGVVALNDGLVGVFYDDGLYAGIAVALGRGLGYVHPNLPGTPAAIHYPPLYPLLLAPLFAGLSVTTAAFLAKVLNVVLATAAASLIAWHATRIRILGDEAPPWLAPAAVVAASAAIPVLTMQSVLFSEPLFALLLASAVMLADRSPERARPVAAAFVAGNVAALALVTRSIAVAAAGGMPAYLLLVRRRPWSEAAALAAPLVAAAAAWAAWTFVHRAGIDSAMAMNYGSYAEVIRLEGWRTFGRRAPDVLRPLAWITLVWLPVRPLYYLSAALALAVFLDGLWLVVRRSCIGLTLAGYLGILALWPYLPDRFIWAVLPWLALVWVAGSVDIYRKYPRLRIPLAWVAGVVLVGYSVLQVRGVAGRWWRSQQDATSANFRELLPGLTHLPPSAVLASDNESLIWLYNRRPTVPFYVYAHRNGALVRPTAAEHRAYLERQGVTHILLPGLGSGSDEELDALLGAYPGWLTVDRVWPGGRALFRVNSGH